MDRNITLTARSPYGACLNIEWPGVVPVIEEPHPPLTDSFATATAYYERARVRDATLVIAASESAVYRVRGWRPWRHSNVSPDWRRKGGRLHLVGVVAFTSA